MRSCTCKRDFSSRSPISCGKRPNLRLPAVMPSIDTQFTLGLELTRLIPLNLGVSKAASYLMSLARDLQVRMPNFRHNILAGVGIGLCRPLELQWFY